MRSKQSLRLEMRGRLLSQDAAARQEKSRRIAEKFLALDAFKRARCVAFYVSRAEEVDTGFLIDQALALGKRAVVPVCHLERIELSLYAIRGREGLQKSALGILEPPIEKDNRVEAREVDLVVVPGVVFDKQNQRIGQGKGFYDRFLTKLRPDTYKVGLAFSFQMVDRLPVESFDVALDNVLTD